MRGLNLMLLTRVTDHLYVFNLQMPVLGITLLHASVLCLVLRIFLRVCILGTRDDVNFG